MYFIFFFFPPNLQNIYSFEDIFLHFLFFEAIYIQSKFCYKLRYPLLRTSWLMRQRYPLLQTSWLMRQTIIFLSLFFISYYWFSYISLFFSLLRIFELFLSMTWVLSLFFPIIGSLTFHSSSLCCRSSSCSFLWCGSSRSSANAGIWTIWLWIMNYNLF